MFKIMLIDSNPWVKIGLESFFNQNRECRLFSADPSRSVLEQIDRNKPDVIIAEHIGQPVDLHGLFPVICKKKNMPEVVIYSVADNLFHYNRFRGVGIEYYLFKKDNMDVLQNTINRIRSPDKKTEGLSPDIKPRFPQDNEKLQLLNEREMTIFRKMVVGKKISEISQELNLSEKTVSVYKSGLLKKLGIHQIDKLMLLAIRNYLL